MVTVELLAHWLIFSETQLVAGGNLDQMADSWDGSSEIGSQSDESFHFERVHLEPIYDAFVCPLTKQVMCDPVTLENGQTFEREAIEKWFKECRESGRKMVCPLTLKELKSTDLNPSIALRNTIEEWTARNEAVQLDLARRSLNLGSSETEILHALKYVEHICQKSRSNKHIARSAGLIPLIVDMLKSSSRRVRCKALESLRIVVEEDAENKVVTGYVNLYRFYSMESLAWLGFVPLVNGFFLFCRKCWLRETLSGL